MPTDSEKLLSAPNPIYPEATRHLPGNAASAKLPTLTGVQPDIIAGADKLVQARVQSLRPYAASTLIYGVFAVLVYTLGRKSLNEGALLVSIPETLQHVGLAAAGIPIVCAPVLLKVKKLQIAKAALSLQLAGYAAVFLTAFGLIVSDFTNFFFGVGLVAVVQVFLGLWTRSVLRDVQDLREA